MGWWDRLLTWTAHRLLGLRGKAAARGERTLAAMFPQGRYGWPGGWSADRLELVSHYRHWVFVAVQSRGNKFAELEPNIAFVSTPAEKSRGLSRKYRKAMSPVSTTEDLTPVDDEHPLRKLLREPNAVDSWWDLAYETNLFQDLTGSGYWWVVPNRLRLPAEIWVIPSHWVWPRSGTTRLIDHYEIRPWGGVGAGGTLYLPPSEVIHFKDKSPVNKLDGYSAQTAGAQWIDTEESITASRWAGFKNGCRPELCIELGPEFIDPSDEDIARVEAKFLARYQGEYQTGRPLIVPPGAKVSPLGWPMTELGHLQSEEQVRDMILALYRVPKTVAGIATEVNRASMDGSLAAFCTFAINPRLRYYGQHLTRHLARRYDEALRIWWDDATPQDPVQLNADLQADAVMGAITPNEIRGVRGRPNYEHGGDDPLLPQGLAPVPLNTGEDLSGLTAMSGHAPPEPPPGMEGAGGEEGGEGGGEEWDWDWSTDDDKAWLKCGGEGSGRPGPCPGPQHDDPPKPKPARKPSPPTGFHSAREANAWAADNVTMDNPPSEAEKKGVQHYRRQGHLDINGVLRDRFPPEALPKGRRAKAEAATAHLDKVMQRSRLESAATVMRGMEL
ncbi:MAG TPA: phage portal protein, partial [Tepidisphaeraceae bacterium]|nr:phage portal protein [Tepidisphaeraceae bacterium]